MTFHVNDRVALTNDQGVPHYDAGAICTVRVVGRNWLTIQADAADDARGIEVYPSSLIHVTNVPSVRPRGSDVQPSTSESARVFGTGATRDLDANKLDFEGFLSPLVLERYAEHMHKARRMPDGTMRASDNWQLGIPVEVYMKSMWRHFVSVWKLHRGIPVFETLPSGEVIEKDLETELCALKFNVSGMLHETLKGKTNANQSN